MVRIRNVNNNSVREVKTVDVDKLDGLVKQRDQYKSERDELSDMLDKECNDNYKLEGQLYDMTKERDSLLKENKALRLQADEYFEFWQDAIKK